MKRTSFRLLLPALATALLLAGCSSTSKVPEGDRLFVGLTPVKYENYEDNRQASATQDEVEAALATAPNGAFFGSSFYRSPFPYRLWIWNAFSDSESPIGKWITKSFGRPPVLMSWVNPALRASVSREVLRAHGYFRGKVTYDEVQLSNPKKAKIAYRVNMGPLFRIDTLRYEGFPAGMDSLLRAHKPETLIPNNEPFDVATLEAERNRVANVFRNNGYYYYQPGMATYLTDTVTRPLTAFTRLQLAKGIQPEALRKWHIGKVSIELRRTFTEQLNDTVRRRFFSTVFNGKRPPLRPGVILRNMRLRPRQTFNYDNYMESANNLSSLGLFSYVDFKFTPRDSSATCDTLDLTLNAMFERPYDFYVETNMRGKATGSFGPELVVGLTKRNAFRGGEKLDVNLHGNYEWQTGHADQNNGSRIHSYEYGADVSLEIPRLLFPRFRRRFYTAPSTLLKASSQVINRQRFFKRHIVSGELTYKFRPTATTSHEFSPLILQYEYMTHTTDTFRTILSQSPYLTRSMADQFVPKLRYTFIYSSPATYRSPIYWETTFSEASNVLAAGYAIAGKRWNEKNKTLFKNPFAQFVKIETDFRKTWRLGSDAYLVGHLAAGAIYSYGNASTAPYSEQFYVGGANSIRAFNIRSIGPGSYYTDRAALSYLDQTGDIKLLGNLELRPRIVGNLHGAVFLDAGNVWAMKQDENRPDSRFRWNKFYKQIALGTGIGLRYDLDFFVIRVDWGIGLHVPYKSGFINVGSFKNAQSLHLAVGYPF